MTGALLPLLSYGSTAAPPLTTQIDWSMNGDAVGDGIPASNAVSFAPAVGVVSVHSSWNGNTTLPTTSPRNFTYNLSGTADPGDNPVLVLVLCGSYTGASDPTSITYKGLTFQWRKTVNGPGTKFCLIGMLPLRDGIPAGNTVTVTWPELDTRAMRARLMLVDGVSASSDDFATGYVFATTEGDADGVFLMDITYVIGGFVVTGLFSQLPVNTIGPTDYVAAGNSFFSDNPYNAAYNEF